MRRKRLMLGAGLRQGKSDLENQWVNNDVVALPGIDVVHDLDEFPWPWDDDEFDNVIAFDIFEHVDDPLEFMAECHRILKDRGELLIHTSYWKGENSYTDPTHKRFCTERTFDYWVPGTYLFKGYGDAYSKGRHFLKLSVQVGADQNEMQVLLRKIGNEVEEMEIVELRCEENPRRLFGKMMIESKPIVVEGNLVEFACRDCAKKLGAGKVLHRFDVAGELVETEVVDD